MEKKILFYLLVLVTKWGEGSVGEVFSERYFQNYRSGQCYENSLGFVAAVSHLERVEKELFLVKLQNKGAGTFGLVNAERARSFVQGKLIAEEKNWYEHWFVIDEERIVYDFDFSSSPSPIQLKDYIEAMFLQESECDTPSWTELCGKREDKLNEYRVTVFEVERGEERNKSEVWSGSLRSFFESSWAKRNE